MWVRPGDGPDWLVGGTYLVARRIRMHIETWDRTSLNEQQKLIGRAKGSGAPLGQVVEFDTVDPHVKGAGGEPLIPDNAHIRLASPDSLGGVRILRGYNFADGSDGLGHLDAGLFFVCFNRDSRKQFVPMQRALATGGPMMEYLEHTGSAIFACPPGVSSGGYWGRATVRLNRTRLLLPQRVPHRPFAGSGARVSMAGTQLPRDDEEIPMADRQGGDRVSEVSEQVGALVRDELHDALRELRTKATQAGLGGALVAFACVLALYAGAAFVHGLSLALSRVLPSWLAATVTGIALSAVAALAGYAGADRIRRAVPPVPEQALSDVQSGGEAAGRAAREQ